MGQTEIIQLLANERKINNHGFLSSKQIHKALKNLGKIVRIENINRSIRRIDKHKMLEVNEVNRRIKKYRLKDRYINI